MVAEDYRTAQVFKNHKINFCCKGNRSLEEVAKKNKLNIDDLLREFEEDLHRHIHLENNILFPKAEVLESKLNV